MSAIYRSPDTVCSKAKEHEGPCGVGKATVICGKRGTPK